MPEILQPSEHPIHFAEKHENGEYLMCISTDSECKILIEILDGYTSEEEETLTGALKLTLQSVDLFLAGRSTDLFAGLHIQIGEDITEGGGKAIPEENKILLNGRKLLMNIEQLREVSGIYTSDELTEFPNTKRPGSALEYTLAHEMGHIIDGQTHQGKKYHRVSSVESPTKYGKEYDQWNSDNKDHEAFAEGFAHLVYRMPVSDDLEQSVRTTVAQRFKEL